MLSLFQGLFQSFDEFLFTVSLSSSSENRSVLLRELMGDSWVFVSPLWEIGPLAEKFLSLDSLCPFFRDSLKSFLRIRWVSFQGFARFIIRGSLSSFAGIDGFHFQGFIEIRFQRLVSHHGFNEFFRGIRWDPFQGFVVSLIRDPLRVTLRFAQAFLWIDWVPFLGFFESLFRVLLISLSEICSRSEKFLSKDSCGLFPQICWIPFQEFVVHRLIKSLCRNV